ncbi:MAG: Phenylacetic acid catabolic protein [Candidatus Binatia bacterium]
MGQLVKEKNDIPDERYRDMLIRLMKRQVMAEYRASLVYSRAVALGPTWKDKILMTRIGAEEGRHTLLVGTLLDDLAIDVEQYLADFFRAHPIAYHDDWHQVVARLFLGDRAAVYQLTTYLNNSYQPWARVMHSIVMDEAGEGGHMDLGVEAVAEICKTETGRNAFQRIINSMLPYAIRLLGDPSNPENEYCRSVGLKTKTSGEVQKEYFDKLIVEFHRFGLRIPNLEKAGIHLDDVADRLVKQSGLISE